MRSLTPLPASCVSATVLLLGGRSEERKESRDELRPLPRPTRKMGRKRASGPESDRSLDASSKEGSP